MRAKGAAFALAVCAIIIAAIHLSRFAAEHAVLADYLAFWCAGSVFAHGGNPYLTAPLLACEDGQPLFQPYHAIHIAIPAPLPGYALFLFTALSYLPFNVAAALWILASLCCLWFSIVTLADLTGRDRATCVAIFVLPALLLWLSYGETVPFALAGSLLVAKGLRERRLASVLWGLLLLSIEPHLAAGVWIAVTIIARRMRIAIASLGVTLAGLWLLLPHVGPVVYFHDVLPLQALSHLPFDGQYSATWIAHALRFSDATALALGSASYVFFTAAAIAVAVVLYKRTGNAALVPMFVIAGEVTGGTYVHESHIAAALPAALFFSPLATLLISIPWLQLSREPMLVPFAACVAGVVAFYLGASKRAATWFGLFALFGLTMFVVLLKQGALETRPFPVHSPFASADAGRYIWSHYASTSAASWLRKVPAWAALAIVWFNALAMARRSYTSNSRRSPTRTSTASSAPAPNSTTVAAP